MMNTCCNWLSAQVFKVKIFREYDIHYKFYYAIRKQFPKLSSQTCNLCIAKVADSYKLNKKHIAKFKELGAVDYDDCVLSWKVQQNLISLWTIEGRKRLKFTCSDNQKELLKLKRNTVKLLLKNRKVYLLVPYQVAEPAPQTSTSYLGVDLGICNLAWDSDNNPYGKHVRNIRRRYRKLRSALQKANTKSAKRHLKKLSGKEHRFVTDVNHCISKEIVKLAEGTSRAVAIEDLSGIRSRITVRKKQRDEQHSWAFYQLRTFLEYKCKLAGVLLLVIDAHYTSQECSKCAFISSKNRKTQDRFVCCNCGYAAHADYNAARVISGRANIIKPIVVSTDVSTKLQAHVVV